MSSTLSGLGREGVAGLLAALNHRLVPPFHPLDLEPIVGRRLAPPLAAELNAVGASVEQLRWTLTLLHEEHLRRQRAADRFELVWTGPKESLHGVRDTSVVVRSLFDAARQSVLVSSYVFAEGHSAGAVWGPLAANLERSPGLDVRLFLHVGRVPRDHRPTSELLRLFAQRVRAAWPGKHLPRVYFDPRAMGLSGQRPVLHAKCVVVDGRRALVTSANFTEAGHERNLEAGILVDDAAFAASLTDQFDALITSGDLRSVPGLDR